MKNISYPKYFTLVHNCIFLLCCTLLNLFIYYIHVYIGQLYYMCNSYPKALDKRFASLDTIDLNSSVKQTSLITSACNTSFEVSIMTGPYFFNQLI